MYNLRASDSANGDVKIIVNLQGQVRTREVEAFRQSLLMHALQQSTKRGRDILKLLQPN